MNAGFVKIYSLLCDDCVIYDGRVGAALGLLTRQFCEVTGRMVVPAMLAFAFGTPKEAPNSKHAKVRDPSRGTLRFPRLRQDARFHTGSGDAGKLVHSPRAGSHSTRLQRWRDRIP